MTVQELIERLRHEKQTAKVYFRNSYGTPTDVSCVAPVKGYAKNFVVDEHGVILLEPVDW